LAVAVPEFNALQVIPVNITANPLHAGGLTWVTKELPVESPPVAYIFWSLPISMSNTVPDKPEVVAPRKLRFSSYSTIPPGVPTYTSPHESNTIPEFN
jgi:hypothetical protein